MRIVGGQLKGQKIPVPRAGVRPTSERVREALMSMLGPDWSEQRILDCFAGSGAFGFECISRGAATVEFVEQNSATCQLISNTAEAFGIENQVTVHRGDATKVLRRLTQQSKLFNVLFFDPPYRKQVLDNVLALAQGLTAADGVVLAEHETSSQPITEGSGFELVERRNYGNTVISVYRRRHA